jgi:hypothetical protein
LKLEPDCVRDVLLEIEAAGLYDTITDETLAVKLPKWSKDAITYTCQMLKSADYIDVEVKHYIRGPEIRVRGMTYKGVAK